VSGLGRAVFARIAFAGLIALGPAAQAAQQIQRAEQQGVRIELQLAQAVGASLHVALELRDATAGTGLSGLRPAAWLVSRDPSEASAERDAAGSEHSICRHKARSLLGGSLFARPELDLNGYEVLMLNEDASVSAVEPNFGFGGARQLAHVDLPAPAYDWLMDREQRHVYLSLPDAAEVARLDLQDWSLARVELDKRRTGPLLLDADERNVWVAVEGGVVMLHAATLQVRAQIDTHPTEPGAPTVLLGSTDGRSLFVGHRASRSLVLIDVANRRLQRRIELDAPPLSAAFSALAQRVYLTLAPVAPTGEGSLVSISARPPHSVVRLPSAPGPELIRFAGEGRYGLVVHPQQQRLSILDSAQDQIVQSARLDGQADQIAFSDELAYLRLRDRSQLLMVPLAAIGQAGQSIPTFDTVGGDRGFVDGFRSVAAAGLAAVPSGGAMLIANPGDRAVYFYKEGLAAPMGQFGTGDRPARAVLAIDRSLRERVAAGRYETVAKPPAAGEYELVLFVNAPRIVQCFPVRIEAGSPSAERTAHLSPRSTRTSSAAASNVSAMSPAPESP
jgi:hypothetical protein